MTPELASLVVAIAIPILTVATLFGLMAGERELEQARDDLIALRAAER